MRAEVVQFLREVGCEQYTAQFLAQGFDDMETLLAAEDADLRDLGIPLYHATRLRQRLHELQRQQAGADWVYDPNHPVVQFLEGIGLPQYAEPLMRHGFDDMEILYDIEDGDMKDIGIPRGHALKLTKRLQEHQLQSFEDLAMAEPAPPSQHFRAAGARSSQSPQPSAPMGRAALQMSQMQQMSAGYLPTDQMKSAVEHSWDQVQALGTYTVGELLYRNLFRVMPDAVQVFPSHVRTKYREWTQDEVGDESNIMESAALRKLFSKFVNAVGCAVAGLHDNTKLVSMLFQLGQRHVNYGVHESHFEALGKAFQVTLQEILGADFTKDVDDAWAMAYKFMSSIMLQGIRIGRAGGSVGPALEDTGSTASTGKGVPGAKAAGSEPGAPTDSAAKAA